MKEEITAESIFQKLSKEERNELMDFSEDGKVLRFEWHDLGILDADGDCDELGFFDCSTLNELGDEVVKLCKEEEKAYDLWMRGDL